jgi:Flp pilus assembly protein TadB
MPTRKQRRRRQKDRRHEYEYVYVDDEGQEVEVDESEAGASRTGKGEKASPKAKPRASGGRMLREPPEPSWSRSVRRAIPWQIGIFVLVVVVLRNSPLASRILVAILYGAFFVPLMYLTDRMMRNRWLKQQGGAPPKDKRPRR